LSRANHWQYKIQKMSADVRAIVLLLKMRHSTLGEIVAKVEAAADRDGIRAVFGTTAESVAQGRLAAG
jgi:hypothetical protein